jgi:AraC-like DNA-binding protein
MEYSELPAPAPLDRVVHCFWFLRGHFPDTAIHPVVADGRVEIILHLAEPFSFLTEDGGSQRQDDLMISGQITRPVHLRGNGAADIVGIRFRTAAAPALVRPPLHELVDRVEPLREVSARLAAELRVAVAPHVDPLARAAVLSRAILRRLHRVPGSTAVSAIRTMENRPLDSVRQIAARHGTTVRTLERHVRESTGLSPATLRRVLRFRRAFRLLDATPRGAWGAVAGRSGYADQSHLIRDFREFAGVTPSEFFREEPELARAIMTGVD